MSSKFSHFENILYAGSATDEEAGGLKQAVSVARNNAADLHILEVCPKLPVKLDSYRQSFESSIKKQTESRLEAICKELEFDRERLNCEIDVIEDRRLAISLVRKVIKGDFDLLMKNVEKGGGKGRLKSIDMALLRKCPCPVWLWRPITKHRDEIRVAVAIDAGGEEEKERLLSVRLLALAESIAETCSGEYDVVSCWDSDFEGYLRSSPLSGRPDESVISAAVGEARETHRKNLKSLLADSECTGKYRVHRLKGRADEAIPKFVEGEGVDILVMGTLARLGIAGFVIGNTAENIVQQLDCTLLTAKPPGFVSPVDPYS